MNVTHVKCLKGEPIPGGFHEGLWSAYTVVVGDKWELTTPVGVRGINIPCRVTVEPDGAVRVDPLVQ